MVIEVKDRIYLDNSATTALSAGVKEAMVAAMEIYGNPSSLHTAGDEAHRLLNTAREQIYSAAGVRQADGWRAVFTASGSEANNLAILGAARAKKHFSSKRILLTDSEHPSVARAVEALTREGFEAVYISTRGGALDMVQLRNEAMKGVFLASFMLVNNETGALYDIDAAARAIRAVSPDALIHCDAVQGFLRQALPRVSCGIDMISVSAHKIHGPKGVGALIISPTVIKRRALIPVIYGGGQEEGLRSGTENLVGIAGFGKAVAEGRLALAPNADKLRGLYSYATERLSALGVTLNVPERHVDHIISVTVPNIKSQTMLNFLSARGICVSSGSACSSHDKKLSPALRAFGLDDKAADSTIRVSLCPENTAEDIDALVSALADGIRSLVKIK
jgi:cysteine desulfurase